MKYIITISREFGCAGREIGREIASELGIKFYDKQLIDMVAQRASISPSEIPSMDEPKEFFKGFLYGASSAFYSEKAIKIQGDVIKELASKESCVFFGRCSDYFLREYDNCFNIFLYAPLKFRIKHIAHEYNLDNKSAEKFIQRIDKQRHNYYKYVTGKNRGDREFKSLMIDVGFFRVDGTVDLICNCIREMYS